jgi:hypothetical protein
MSDSCPLPIDWLDYLENEKPAEMEDHLRSCPSCREVLSLLSEQSGNVPSPAWTEHLVGLEGAQLTEEKVSDPAPAELWFSAGHWTFHDAEYRPPERSLVLVLSEALQETGDHSWYDVTPVRTDVENALPTDFLVTAEESSFDCSLRVVLSFQCKVERRQLGSRVGRLTDIDIIISALSDETSAWRWGNPLENPQDPRLWWEPSFSETMVALRGPWLQYLDDAARAGETEDDVADVEVLDFFPKEWIAEAERELVAASSSGKKKTRWELKSPHLQMAGIFEFEGKSEILFFAIQRLVSKRPLRLRLVLYVKGSDEPEESEEFEPEEGYRVSWALPYGPGEVDRLSARVVG